jgi:hypothetical protein
MQIQAHDVGHLGCKLQVGVNTSAASLLEVHVLAAQDPPDLMGRDIAQGLHHQLAALPGVSRRWLVELGENPLAGGFV